NPKADFPIDAIRKFFAEPRGRHSISLDVAILYRVTRALHQNKKRPMRVVLNWNELPGKLQISGTFGSDADAIEAVLMSVLQDGDRDKAWAVLPETDEPSVDDLHDALGEHLNGPNGCAPGCPACADTTEDDEEAALCDACNEPAPGHVVGCVNARTT